jgi:hypothetical protein
MDPLETIPEAVRPRLLRAIKEMLHARVDTVEISNSLGAQQSFGKYDGCTPLAILSIANAMCKDINKQYRAAFCKTVDEAKANLLRDFPELGKRNFRN